MCGIVCAFDLKEKVELLRPQVLEMSKKIVIAVRIGVKFIQMIKRFWLTKGFRLLIQLLGNSLNLAKTKN